VSATAKESSNAESNFHRVEARIVVSQPGIRDMQVACFQTPVVLCPTNVSAHRCGGSEVHAIRSRRHIVVGGEHSTVEFEIRGKASVASEVPLKSEWAESHPVSGIRGLEDKKHRGGVNGVLKTSAEEAGEMRPGKDPSIAQAGIEYANILCAASHGVAASNPQLNFMAALLRADLGDAGRCSE
jgi:hypothetical protein